jgi:putative FmdB family regulatory protein
MPTYEFRCPEGHEFEKFYHSISAAPRETLCPTCGLVAERQLSAGGGLVFKGSGFYITDYGKDGKKQQTPPPAAVGGECGGSKTDAGKSDAKPDAKAGGESKPSESKPSESKAAEKPPAAKKKATE